MMPMFHIAGAGWSMVGLVHGCRTVVLRDVDPAAILAAIPVYGITNAFMVPAVIQFVLATPGVESTDFSTLRALVYGASPITDKVLVAGMETFGCEFIQVYGLTETTGAITQLEGTDHDTASRPHLLRSCGKPYPWVEVRIVEPTTGEDVPLGEVGELWTRSRQNMVGYWENPKATAEAVTPDGWFRTGDAGYVGRRRLSLPARPGEGHDRVRRRERVPGGGRERGRQAPGGGRRGGHRRARRALGRGGEGHRRPGRRHRGRRRHAQDIIAFAREHLAGYKLPKSVDFAEVLPRNPSGKLLKRELREPYWQGGDRQIG